MSAAAWVLTGVWSLGTLVMLVASGLKRDTLIDDRRARYRSWPSEDDYWAQRRRVARRMILCWAWPAWVLMGVWRIVEEAVGWRED